MTSRPATASLLEVLGFEPRMARAGESSWEYTVDPEHHNPFGVLHGGVTMALLDTAMGYAVARLVGPDGAISAAAQMSVHFLEPIRAGKIVARAEVRKCGKRLAVVDAQITDEVGAVLAVASATHAILKQKTPPARGRDRS